MAKKASKNKPSKGKKTPKVERVVVRDPITHRILTIPKPVR